MTPYSYKAIHNLAPAIPPVLSLIHPFIGFISSLLNNLKIHKLIMLSHASHLISINPCLLNRFYLHFQMRKLKLTDID